MYYWILCYRISVLLCNSVRNEIAWLLHAAFGAWHEWQLSIIPRPGAWPSLYSGVDTSGGLKAVVKVYIWRPMNAEKFGALWKYCGAHVKSLISGIQFAAHTEWCLPVHVVHCNKINSQHSYVITEAGQYRHCPANHNSMWLTIHIHFTITNKVTSAWPS